MYEEPIGMEYLRPTPMGVPLTPSMSVSIGKIDNGYVLKLNTIPKRRPMPRFKAASSPFAGMDPDEMIDKIVDGMGALIRSINDKGAGEDWKTDEDRAKVRDGFKAMFPSLVPPPPPPPDEEAKADAEAEEQMPRSESRVFESKEALMRYLTENL